MEDAVKGQGIMVWVSPLEKPAEKRFEELAAQGGQCVQTGDLQTLACGCRPKPGLTPWIKMSTGGGSAFFNDHAIRAIQQAFCPQVYI